jgi:salicylate hydroxylase
VTAARTVFIAGAGIAGLTAALALAAKGFRVIIAEKAERLEEAGAGLQLSPNASRILIDLGLRARLEPHAIAPDAVSLRSVRHGGEISRLPFHQTIDAPYWVLHRADLQAALTSAVDDNPAIELRLGTSFEQADAAADGVVIHQRSGASRREDRASALIGADGVWSAVRRRLNPDARPKFSGLIAWRGTADASSLPRELAPPRVQVWMGPETHLVVYPIAGGRQVNMVAVASGTWNEPGWSVPADAAEIANRFAAARWPAPAQAMIGAVETWRKWALFAMPDMARWNEGAIALIGDAAHAMLPFAAQGAGMAIEDAAVLAACLGNSVEDAAAALARYGDLRRARVARVRRLAQRNGQIYHLRGAAALARDLAIAAMGPARLMARQNWIYGWRP